MPRSLLAAFTALLACSPLAPPKDSAAPPPAVSQAPAPEAPNDPPPLAREFRGAWVATVNNSDFPSRPGLSSAELRAELDAIVARAAQLRLNALVFQVRPAADAFYASRLEPWSEWLTGTQGKAPDGNFDPLAYVIERCHAQGLQLHAWFNPYRSRHAKSRSAPAAGHVSQKAPHLVRRYGAYEWMDPGEPLAATWSLATVQDVVRRYDVDGVHIDDYFYPYPEGKLAFPDDTSYAAYRAGGGELARSDWRRANIDGYVQRMYSLVHDDKPWVAVGISPFGIARPGVPAGIQAGIDQYEQLSADVRKWLREGWLDYLAPQLYWPIDQTAQSFPVLLAWWHTQNPRQRAIWPGLNAGKMIAGGKNIRRDELAQEITLVRGQGRETGHILFPFKPLFRDDANGGGALRQRLYLEPALPPALPWLGAAAPKAPTARLGSGARPALHWQVEADVRTVAVQVRTDAGWRTAAVLGAGLRQWPLPDGCREVALTAVSRTGICSPSTRLRVE